MGTSLPSCVSTVAPIETEYFVPSLKMWPISIALNTSSVPDSQRGQASPAATVRRSAQLSGLMSRSMSTPRRWKSSLFAPVLQGHVGDDAEFLLRGLGLRTRADAAEAPGRRAEESAYLFGVGGPDGR